ncbi:MAG: NAD(P)H-dependent oxidoreductase subunit E [Bacteroidales bacterium]|jgi:NADH:ubiquinone oxidoreductase subunit E|nr:NAD(P)H-dependent oxidoreductase subunit E [Bacteroidales bacterium]MDD2687220.1 NAD(P)H-dependent oxidoreductase subunit E [Bacteroidales bacterium]MDD3330335.1 NAD(P)H-dependent oxidoreductase subunit E [Bacteroidales bacterium]MDD3691123.1 NAD(P)H-dependent oxidoreductase subunit E [Bacteroidales bacterium]MDD4044773.1 NAD(P)H-dependent oxidoreductase subunit E [Bacteroidales bacterium]
MKENIEILTKKFGRNREALIPILQAIVEKNSYLSEEAMNEVAKQLDISAAQVYGTASFYSFLDTVPRGKNIIRVCKSIIAEMKGKKEIIKTLENVLKIKVGETTPDNMFTLLETNDIGWSDQEPSMLINDQPYTNLTSEKVIRIINEYRK